MERVNLCGKHTYGAQTLIGRETNIAQYSHCSLLTRGGSNTKESSFLTSKMEGEVELLKRHVTMLQAIMEHQPIGIIRLSEQLNIPQHKVRYSLRILEQEGLIKPSPEGAITTDNLPSFVGELRETLGHIEEEIIALKGSLD